jgi:hypothetical protein
MQDIRANVTGAADHWKDYDEKYALDRILRAIREAKDVHPSRKSLQTFYFRRWMMRSKRGGTDEENRHTSVLSNTDHRARRNRYLCR